MGKSDKPNILIIWGDDIGYWNVSHYSKGMMGYQTPNTQWLSPGRDSHLGPRDVFRRHSFEMAQTQRRLRRRLETSSAQMRPA
jgi:hypothetical protein